MEVDQLLRAHAVGRLRGVVVSVEEAGLAGAAGEVLVAELDARGVVLAEQEGVTAAVGLRCQRVHD